MVLVFAMISFEITGGAKVFKCMWPFHSRISQNNVYCLSRNMITALQTLISIRADPTPLVVPSTYISNSIRPGKKMPVTTMFTCLKDKLVADRRR